MISKSTLFTLSLILSGSMSLHAMHIHQTRAPDFYAAYSYPRPPASAQVQSGANDVATVGKVIVAAGCAAAIGYGLYKFFDWLLSPSTEKIIQNGVALLHDAHNRNDSTILWMEGFLSEFPENPYEQECLINQPNERLLYSLAAQFDYSVSLIDLESSLSKVRAMYQTVIDRMKKLHAKNDTMFMGQLQDIERELCVLRTKLQFVCDYLKRHQSYFTVFEHEKRALRTYESELMALGQHSNNPPYLRELLRVSVMRSAAGNRDAFPYMHYAQKMQADCNHLERSINNLAFTYPDRSDAARGLLHQLESICNFIIIEDAYHQELRDYERVQLERERLEAQKAQAAAAAAQAAAMQQQVWHMQQQNALHAQQVNATHQQNAILAANALVNAINPQPNVHVYL